MNINIQYVIDAAKQDMGRNWAYGSGFEALKEHCQKLITLLEEACVELEEDDGARARMRDILVRTANAFKGDPGPVRMHSWHDLPDLALSQRGDERDGWIPVSERLPDECVKVLIVFDDSYGGSHLLATREGDKWFDESPLGELRQLSDVTHWQPLPAAPKEPL